MLISMVDHAALAKNSLRYEWASGRIREGFLTVSLVDVSSRSQILVHVPWRQEPPDEIAEKAAAILRMDPNQWRDVTWHGVSSEPPFDGPGWRK